MERIVGIDKLRPRLGEYLRYVEEGDVVIVSSRSEPKGVFINYSMYNELRKAMERLKQLEIMKALDEFRENAEKIGFTEEDVANEIKEVRKCER